jgi:hypothetical protein
MSLDDRGVMELLRPNLAHQRSTIIWHWLTPVNADVAISTYQALAEKSVQSWFKELLMRHYLYAAASAAAALAMAPVAFAAPVITYSPIGLDGSFTAQFENLDPTTQTNNGVLQFADVFSPFTVTTAGTLSGTIGTSATSQSTDLDFTLARVTLVGSSAAVGTAPNDTDFFPLTYAGGDQIEQGNFASIPIGPGTYNLRVSGDSRALGVYSGTLAFAANQTPAVPEPATWGMMLVGFGAIGAGMRRRKAAGRRVNFNFA